MSRWDVPRKILRWWMAEGPAPPPAASPTRFVRAVRRVPSVLALALAAGVGLFVTRGLRRPPPPPLPAEGAEAPGIRFGLDEPTRRAIFAKIAATDGAARRRAEGRFADAWSREDDRAADERQKVFELARERGISLSQVYLVMDEGIRGSWPAPNGKRLDASTVPLKPRR